MRWFKHLTNAHDDECMSELIDEFGPEGYGVWWIILEKIAAQMDKTERCFARYSLKKWSKTCGISVKKFQKTVSFLSKLEKVTAKKCEKNSDFLIIECRNLLKFRDEYTKKSIQTPDKRRILSGATPDQETDEQKQKQKQKQKQTPHSPPREFFEPEPKTESEDTTVQDAFLDCEKFLGMSQQEIIEIYSVCHERERFAEAVRFAIEKNNQQLLENPSGFIRWAYENGKTSKETRTRHQTKNPHAAKYDPEFAAMLE